MRNKTKWLVLTMTALTVFATACGNNDNASSENASASNGAVKKTIKVAYGKWNETDNWGKWLASVKTEFEQSHEGVTVELQPIEGAQYSTKIRPRFRCS